MHNFDPDFSPAAADAIRDSIKKYERAAERAGEESVRELRLAEEHKRLSERKLKERGAHAAMVAAFRAQLELVTGEPVGPPTAAAAETEADAEAEANGSRETEGRARQPKAEDRVLAIVNKLGRPVTINEVAEQLPDLKHKTAGWALWKLDDVGLIKKIARAKYAPLSYEPDEQSLTPPAGSEQGP